MNTASIDFSQFEAPPGHLTISTVHMKDEQGNSAIIDCQLASELMKDIRMEAHTQTPEQRNEIWEHCGRELASGPTNPRVDNDALLMMAVCYLVYHPEKQKRRALWKEITTLVDSGGCHVLMLISGDKLATVVYDVKQKTH